MNRVRSHGLKKRAQTEHLASRWREKSVLITVYVEVPRKRSIANNGQNNHQRRHHLFVHEKRKQVRGYNRKAELLEYSRRLRESAKSCKAVVLELQPKQADTLQRSRSQIIPVQKKLRSTRVPTCFGALTIRLPGFSRANRDAKKKSRNGQSTKAKMMSIVKSLRVQSTAGFFSRMVVSLRRKR